MKLNQVKRFFLYKLYTNITSGQRQRVAPHGICLKAPPPPLSERIYHKSTLSNRKGGENWMGQSFKIISCLSSEFCRDYDCMLQGHHSVIRASQCTEHWVSAIQNIKIDTYALPLAFKSFYLQNLLQRGWRRLRRLALATVGPWRTSSSRRGWGWASRTSRQLIIWIWKPGPITAKKQCLFIQSHSAAEAEADWKGAFVAVTISSDYWMPLRNPLVRRSI